MPAKTARKAAAAPVDEIKQQADQLIDNLVEGTPQNALAFAVQFAEERARAQMHGVFKLWSLGNRLYLEGQVRKRGASVRHAFAGKKQWESMGRQVLENELDKPFKIQGSPFYTVRQEDPATGLEERVMRRGRAPVIEVYDWSQTRSTDENYVEPDWEAPISAGDHPTLQTLVDSSPLPVTFADLSATNAHGRYDGQSITIDSAIPVGNQIVELARQLARHELGHTVDLRAVRKASPVNDEFTVRTVQASEAALTGWMVGKALGLDDDTDGAVTQQAAEYLHTWTVEHDGAAVERVGRKSRRKLLRSRIDTAMKATDAILGRYCEQARRREQAA